MEHLIRIPYRCLSSEAQARHHRRLQGRPGARSRHYIAHLAWEPLWVSQEEVGNFVAATLDYLTWPAATMMDGWMEMEWIVTRWV